MVSKPAVVCFTIVLDLGLEIKRKGLNLLHWIQHSKWQALRGARLGPWLELYAVYGTST